MKQIYHFEQYTPPALNENLLLAEMERRKLRLQTALFAFAGILFQIVVVLLGYSAIGWYPWLASACVGYVIVSTTGGGVIAITYSRKGGHTV